MLSPQASNQPNDSKQPVHQHIVASNTTSFRPRVLLIAERANPEYTSIPLHGWSHGRAIANLADVHIVTQHWNGPAFIRAGFTNFTAINTSIVHEPMKRLIALLRRSPEKGWTTETALSAIEYYYFEFLVWRRFKQQIKSGAFDLVHRLIPSSPTAASLIAAKCKQAGIPFILGPLNGGLPWPKQFEHVRRQEQEWLSYVRGLYRLMPGYKSTRKHAAAIIAASQSTLSQIAAAYQHKCIYCPENGVDMQRFRLQRQHLAKLPLKVVFIGRLVPYKGADMLIEAAASLLRTKEITLEIIGEGPERSALAAQLQQLGLTGIVALTGYVPQAQLPKKLAAADVFAFPSIREFGGSVVVEAMATGLVPVVVDYGGPGEIVTQTTGYKIPLSSRAEIVEGFRQSLERLVACPQQVDTIGDLARQRILSKFTWEEKSKRTLEVYRWVLEEGAPKPDPNYYRDDPDNDPNEIGDQPSGKLYRQAQRTKLPRLLTTAHPIGEVPCH